MNRRVRVMVTALGALVLVSGYSAVWGSGVRPASADTLCKRSGCDVVEPYSFGTQGVPVSDCGNHSAVNVESIGFVNEDNDFVTLQLKYSRECISNWTEYWTPSPHQGFIYIHSKSSAPNDNVQAVGGGDPHFWTTMVEIGRAHV